MIFKSRFITFHKKDVNVYYNVLKSIGEGAYGEVFRIQNLNNGNIYACKRINKEEVRKKGMQNALKEEIKLLRLTDHPNIIKLYEVYADEQHYNLITEECTGGSFFDRIKYKSMHKNMYNEKEAAKIFKQILEAVFYLHSHSICHRDIKPENLLFASIDSNASIKLIDFGFATQYSADNHTFHDIAGSINYMAPEIINKNYTELCDEWSCGVILYFMLSGRRPFDAATASKIKEKVLKIDYHFNHTEFEDISEDAINLIKSILVPENKRPTVGQILESKWVKEFAPEEKEGNLTINWNSVNRYSKLNLLQKSILNFTAFHLTEENTKKINQMFKDLDKDSDGVISIEEFKDNIKKTPYKDTFSEEEIDKLFEEIDVDKNGLINYTELLSALIDRDKFIKLEQIKECFKAYDTDNSGKISVNELKEILADAESEEQEKFIENLFQKLDKNGDGVIDFQEFIDAFYEKN